MAFNGNEGNMISRNEARQLMDNYLNSPAYSANNETEGILFGKDHLDALLAQSGCKGIRIYYGKEGTSSSDKTHMVLVGTDVDGNDMVDLILDMGLPCPTYCSSASSKL